MVAEDLLGGLDDVVIMRGGRPVVSGVINPESLLVEAMVGERWGELPAAELTVRCWVVEPPSDDRLSTRREEANSWSNDDTEEEDGEDERGVYAVEVDGCNPVVLVVVAAVR